ncbi:WXG100 family type VII secretion target [Streptomyces sp. SPB162]|uniref:WXG100 family type VII secretion target n=1 Tax=Streptomyces sp. SPB162 TaxID=2940560 RepID=UPI002404A8CD|nr:WXG100 family type VII secretion target [Streptomyces sp. SPB162]MDF9813832.1 WXG100 family type VII secretion target [Streptomyces sp. SPB162]
MAMSGADLEMLRKLSTRFGKDHVTLDGLIKSLNSASKESHGYWSGPLADNFRRDWEALQPSITKIINLLDDAKRATDTHHGNISRATTGH